MYFFKIDVPLMFSHAPEGTPTPGWIPLACTLLPNISMQKMQDLGQRVLEA